MQLFSQALKPVIVPLDINADNRFRKKEENVLLLSTQLNLLIFKA